MYGYFGAYWGARSLSLGEYIQSFGSFLLSLQRLHPAFKGLYHVGKKPHDETPVSDDMSNLAELSLERAWDRKAPRKWYSDVGPDGFPTLSSVSEKGYLMIVANGDKAKKGSDYVYISLMAGATSQWLNNAAVIRFSGLDDTPFSDSGLATRVLNLMAEHWSPDSALVTREDFRDLTYMQDDGRSIGWMTYFSNPAVAAALPDAIDHRPFGPQGGVLITTAPHLPSAEDAEAAASAIQVAEALRSQGLMS